MFKDQNLNNVLELMLDTSNYSQKVFKAYTNEFPKELLDGIKEEKPFKKIEEYYVAELLVNEQPGVGKEINFKVSFPLYNVQMTFGVSSITEKDLRQLPMTDPRLFTRDNVDIEEPRLYIGYLTVQNENANLKYQFYITKIQKDHYLVEVESNNPNIRYESKVYTHDELINKLQLKNNKR